MRRQLIFDAVQFTELEAVETAKFYRTIKTVEIKKRFFTSTSDVDVCGPVVVRVYGHEQPVDPENSWHERRIAYS
jgi:hypothetical protein